MGCTPSHQPKTEVLADEEKNNSNNYSTTEGYGQESEYYINHRNGRAVANHKNGVKKDGLLHKTNSLTITDQSKEHGRTGEEPAHPLPVADYGDMRLGLTVSNTCHYLLSL